eukprot:g54166.t1
MMSDFDDEESGSEDDFDPQEEAILRQAGVLPANEGAATQPKPQEGVNNQKMLEAKLEEIKLPSDYGWIETLQITSNAPMVLEDANDDPAREAEFYKSTLNGVKQALVQFEQGNIPFQRPADYFAEMLKPDAHMARIKDSLLREKKKMTIVAERKQKRELKKLAKSVHSEKLKERAKSKSEHMEKLKQMRKAKDSNTNMKDISERTTLPVMGAILDQSLGTEETEAADAAAKQKRKSKRGYDQEMEEEDGKPQKSKKRQRIDKKYGYGGKKKPLKKNDATSSGEGEAFKAFNPKRNRTAFPGMKRGRGLDGRGPGRGGGGGRGGFGGVGRGGFSGGGRGGFSGGGRGGFKGGGSKKNKRPGKSKRKQN